MTEHILGPTGAPITTRNLVTIRDLMKDVARNLAGGSPIDKALSEVRKTGKRYSVAVGFSWDEGGDEVAIFLVDVAPKEKGN